MRFGVVFQIHGAEGRQGGDGDQRLGNQGASLQI